MVKKFVNNIKLLLQPVVARDHDNDRYKAELLDRYIEKISHNLEVIEGVINQGQQKLEEKIEFSNKKILNIRDETKLFLRNLMKKVTNLFHDYVFEI